MGNRKEKDKQTREKIEEMLASMPDFVTRFLRSVEFSTSVNTQLAYLHDINMFLGFLKSKDIVPDIKSLGMLTKDDFDDWLHDMSATCNMAALKRRLSALRRLYAWLFKSGYIASNELEKVEMPKIPGKKIIYMDDAETGRFLQAAESGIGMGKHQALFHEKLKTRDLALLYLMLSTGIRVSECTGLDITDVDLEKSSIKVTRKGGNEDILYFSDEASAYLSEYMEKRRHMEADTAALFLSERKTRLSVRSVQVLVKKYADICALNKHITPHKLRSTYATKLYDGTGDIYLVSTALGHRNVQTTKDRYAHMPEDKKRENRNIVNLGNNFGNSNRKESEN